MRGTKNIRKSACVIVYVCVCVYVKNSWHEIYPVKFLSAQDMLLTILLIVGTMWYGGSLEFIHLV